MRGAHPNPKGKAAQCLERITSLLGLDVSVYSHPDFFNFSNLLVNKI
ncbi:hypothetical protein DES35_1088 [Schleiferia thermophila]|jgi:hypothetical protein|uniref:Uncharacterized protein n=1 Tax=Schleiferia thermophila TaxID=884107 RepID=A0A368ZVX5_9FLAO|nr:hypothetical protein DES35_1088 [Schleiferia thermophila]